MLYNRPRFEATEAGLAALQKRYTYLVDASHVEPTLATQLELEHSRNFVGRLLEVLHGESAGELFRSLNVDVLGAYFFDVPEIHLYWMAIGLFAGTLSVSVEALTQVVLLHELAHAYTHRGRDIDGSRWKTPAFANCDIRIVEGLAQFYTRAIGEKLGLRSPSVSRAFERLLAYQSEPYTVHASWAAGDDAVNEIVRGCLIECRHSGLTDYEEFTLMVKRFQSQIRH